MVDQKPVFDKEKRPKVGMGIMVLNEFDEVIVS